MDWASWNAAVLAGDAALVSEHVAAGVATTPLHTEAFLKTAVTAPWSEQALALYLCGPGTPVFSAEGMDVYSEEAMVQGSHTTLALRLARWFTDRCTAEPGLLQRLDLLEPVASVRPALHGSYDALDADTVPWIVHLATDHPWPAETPVQMLLLQLWQAGGAWTTESRAQRNAYPWPPTIALLFLFYFRDLMPGAESALLEWLTDLDPGTLELEDLALRDLLTWNSRVPTQGLPRGVRIRASLGLPVSLPHDEETLAELVYLGVPGAAEALGVPPPSGPWDTWLESLPSPRALVAAAPVPVLLLLMERKVHLPLVMLAVLARGFLLDDRVLVLLDAFPTFPSSVLFLEIAARWRGTRAGLDKVLEACARAGYRLPGAWWTAVAYDNTTWQEDILDVGPDWVTADDLLLALGETQVRASLRRWDGRADLILLRKQVEAYLALNA